MNWILIITLWAPNYGITNLQVPTQNSDACQRLESLYVEKFRKDEESQRFVGNVKLMISTACVSPYDDKPRPPVAKLEVRK